MRRWQGCLLAGLTLLVRSGLGGATEPHESPAAIRALFANGNVESAKNALLDCADAQNGECQHYLGKLVEEGKIFEGDSATARQLFELAYRNGYEPAGADLLRLTRANASEEIEGSRAVATRSPGKPIAPDQPPSNVASVPPARPTDTATRTQARDFSFLQDYSANALCGARQRNREAGSAADQLLNDALDREFHRRANVGASVSCIGGVAAQSTPRAHVATRSEPQRGTRSSPRRSNDGPSVGLRIASMIAQGIGAIGEGMARGSRRGNAVVIGQGCSSDFNCSYGERCVKPPLKMDGVCLKAVDSNGMPTLDGPSSESIYPRTSLGCISSVECPIGFSCHSQLKVCTKP